MWTSCIIVTLFAFCEVGVSVPVSCQLEKDIPLDIPLNTSSCYVYANTCHTWVEAASECSIQGCYLYKITDDESFEDIKSVILQRGLCNSGVWIGSTRTHSGQFQWEDGTPTNTSTAYWLQEEPNNCCGKNESCVEIRNFNGLLLNDESCDQPRGYACQCQRIPVSNVSIKNLSDTFLKINGSTSSVEFECTVPRSRPKATIMWFKNTSGHVSLAIDSTETRTIANIDRTYMTIGRLNISVSQADNHLGVYCAASNGVGNVHRTDQVTLIFESDSPLYFYIIEETVTETFAVVTWLPSSNHRLPQTFQLQYRSSGSAAWRNTTIDERVSNNRREMFVVLDDLQSDTEYQAELFSFDIHARSKSLHYTFFTKAHDTKSMINKSQPEKDAPIGAIVGGVVSGCVILLFVAVVILMRRKYDITVNIKRKGM
ncbi:hypothetical protein DPMN_081230 [Dreissena polymorpha]|uniref:Uncharacterized protein n=1 Tax=Dreissena polymorpha TaxID=45954 RepID=A0A9D3Y7N6_DREPO|nr:hypothetical protein DPMN_081230 [Dreissena polymorpha]